MAEMQTARVVDLVGKDVKGLKAIVTAPEHRYQYPSGVPVVTLEKVEWKRENGHKWLMIRWDGTPHDGPTKCGYSGRRDDHENLKHWTVEIERGANQ